MLPGSRKGEIERHLPVLIEAVRKIRQATSPSVAPRFILAVPSVNLLGPNFRERISEASIQVLEGQTWDVLACAELALAASGTVTIEATLVGTPMVTFYRVNKLSWLMGKYLVKSAVLFDGEPGGRPPHRAGIDSERSDCCPPGAMRRCACSAMSLRAHPCGGELQRWHESSPDPTIHWKWQLR